MFCTRSWCEWISRTECWSSFRRSFALFRMKQGTPSDCERTIDAAWAMYKERPVVIIAFTILLWTLQSLLGRETLLPLPPLGSGKMYSGIVSVLALLCFVDQYFGAERVKKQEKWMTGIRMAKEINKASDLSEMYSLNMAVFLFCCF